MIKAALAFKVQEIRFCMAKRKAIRHMKQAKKHGQKAEECNCIMWNALAKMRQIKKDVDGE